MIRPALLCLLATLALSPSLLSAEPAPSFTQRPAVARDGDAVRIDFAVDRPTDVAVTIEAGGRVVRHLAAGMLGPKAPAPLKANALAQSLTWDGRDDRGRPVDARADVIVRVRLGTQPRLARIIGDNPAEIGGVRGIAPGPDGKVYVIHTYGGTHPMDAGAAIAVFSREGRYLKTIAPWPADLPDAAVAGYSPIRLDDGRRVPRIFQFETRSYVPGLGDIPNHRPVVTRDGRLAFSGIDEGPRPFAQPGASHLTVINTDGSVPAAGAVRTLIHPLTDTAASLALSPDEKTIYAAGVRAGTHASLPGEDFVCDVCDHGGTTWDHTDPVPYVYRFGWNSAQAELLAGGNRSRDKADYKLVEPVSVATDAAGLVYIADVAGDQIVVIRDERTAPLVTRIAVESPWAVEVSRKTGAIYVLAGRDALRLIKLDGRERGQQVAALELSQENRRGVWPIRRPLVALDDSGDVPTLWLNWPFARVEDKGKALQIATDLRDEALVGPGNISSIMELTLDPLRGVLYLGNGGKLDVATGKWGKFRVDGGAKWPRTNPGSVAGCVGLDGNYYSSLGSRGAYVFRYDGDTLKELPFPNSNDAKRGGRLAGFSRDWARGLAADASGNVYAVFKRGGVVDDASAFHKAQVVSKFAPDGRLLAPALIDSQMTLDSVRVDYQGNLYVVAGLRPGDHSVPPGLVGKVAEGPADSLGVNKVSNYPLIYGSLIKFPPTGGTIRQDIGGVKCNFGPGRPIEVKGAEWIVSGVSVTPAWAAPKRDDGTIISCVCEAPGVAVDAFGRAFYPDAGRCRVGMVDAAGNELAPIGQYGNPDAKGGDGVIPLAWPQAVATDGRTLYIADRVNRRLLEVTLDCQAEATANLK